MITVTALVMVPIVISILTDHLHKQTKLKQTMLKDQIELEKRKHENFLLETEKMKLELEILNQECSNDQKHLL
ncbi:MAG: hypothetical protein ABF649_07960 [Bacillus sp. (in: firmicutes)]